jgi:hypothetical protein
MANSNESGFGRREFIGAAAAALFAGVVIQITGCSKDSGTGSEGGAGDAVGSISGNHPTPHSAVVTKAKIDAGGDVTLDIQGAASHSHTISLTAADMATLKAKGHVMLTSTEGGSDPHTHVVMFN